MDTASLVAHLDLGELTAAAPNLVAWNRGLVDDEDAVAAFMVRGGPRSPTASAAPRSSEDGRPDASYWQAVKTEMRLFLCTDDSRYAELWARINALEAGGTTALVGLISTFLGATIGAPATLIAGFVAVCLYGMAKIGKEAWCRYDAPTTT